ncbi:glycosyltransferase family 9 protein [Candidatus Obscuribacterales bacterium]|nr:glycosyltransferase family 9 protein [Candidatus Obscuribacterales bacterium]
MKSPTNIVIFHPAAIGDAMLATPVAAILKRNFSNAHISYWTHESLKILIKDMCPPVDGFVDYKRGQNIFKLSGQLKSLNADLFVDLSNSSKGKLMSLMSGTKAVHYKKRKDGVKPIRHAADNFVDTIRTIANDIPKELFPTVFPSEQLLTDARKIYLPEEAFGSKPLIAIVPGVGKLRPNRAWTMDGVGSLVDLILEKGSHLPILIGGPDETELGAAIETSRQGQVANLCGKLNLANTAAILKQCQVVVSGDTGPAHISVAVGVPVIGLYGPTAYERSGPYGCEKLVIDKQADCRCQYEKQCRFTEPGTAGECMSRITTGDIIEKLNLVLNF